MSRPSVAIIAALARNRIIGRDGGLPWRLPSDLQRFKRLTLGHPIIMGRSTFESIGRPLPNRRNLVLSRTGFKAPGIEVVESLEAAIDACAEVEQVFIGGGAAVYTAALPVAHELHLSVVDAQVEGDTWFPTFDPTAWAVKDFQVVLADANHTYSHTWWHLTRPLPRAPRDLIDGV